LSVSTVGELVVMDFIQFLRRVPEFTLSRPAQQMTSWLSQKLDGLQFGSRRPPTLHQSSDDAYWEEIVVRAHDITRL
jgi:hypothetical protein